MPFWFKYSKNTRTSKTSKDRKFEKANNSTMNRICKAFEDIGNINMNFAGIGPFNWQMLLSAPCVTSKPEIPAMFCEMDSRNTANCIEAQEENYMDEREMIDGIRLTAEEITHVFEKKYGSLEEVYPYLVKHLFAGDGMNRAAHKQMFWQVFGEIALENLKKNLETCDVCPECGMKIPSWVDKHVCDKNMPGFFSCVECGKICERITSKQCRCVDCQNTYVRNYKRMNRKNARIAEKEKAKARIGRLASSSQET